LKEIEKRIATVESMNAQKEGMIEGAVLHFEAT